MRVKIIKIFGFKSFADKTVLHFHPGITAIVGPNGCGKSNISDAFRWLFGEQSAKSMRGDKMVDVIFAGTAKRKPLNIAEVSITFTDCEGHLPVDYNEVEVTRRLHRSGESDYFINGQKVRQKDVIDLFLDTGVGKDSFAVFEQGKIDQVIQNTPLERRTIFEEAAGIMRFLQRKKEAFKRLNQVEANILRVIDIHQEVEKQIVVLEAQAKKAQQFKEQKVELDQLEKGLFAAKWGRLLKRKESVCEKMEAQTRRLSEENARLEGFLAQRNLKLKELDEVHVHLNQKNEHAYEKKNDLALMKNKRQAENNRLQEIQRKEKAWQEEIAALVYKRQKWNQEESIIKERLNEEAIEEAKNQLETTQQEVLEEESDLEALRQKLRALQQEHLQLVQQEKQKESNLKQSHFRFEHTQEQKKRLVAREENLKESLEETKLQISLQKKESAQFQEIISCKKGAVSEVEKNLDALTKEIHLCQNSVHECVKKLAEANAREKILLRLKEEKQGFSQGSKRLIKEKQLKPLSELFSAEDESVATVMRPYSQTLVVKTEDELHQVLEFARQEKLKDISLICEELAPDLSKHFLKDVQLALNEKSALSIGKAGKAAYTKEDIFVDRNSVLFFRTQGENHVFLRETELKKLSTQIKKLQGEKEGKEAILEKLQIQRKEASEEKNRLSDELRRQEMQAAEGNFALKRLEGDLIKAEQELARCAKELAELAESLETVTKMIAELEEGHEEAKQKAKHSFDNFSKLEEELNSKREKMGISKQKVSEKESLYRRLLEEHRQKLHALNVLEIKLAESHEQEKRLEREIQQGIEQQNQIVTSDSSFEEQQQAIEKRLEEMLHNLQEMEKSALEKKEEIRVVENAIEEKRQEQKTLEGENTGLEIELAKIVSSLEALQLEVNDRYELAIGELEDNLEISQEQAERKIRSLKRQMEDAGAINMTSIEAFQEQKERFWKLEEQMKDLNDSKDELVKIISQLDSESRKNFKETFEQIRLNFQKNFQMLFNGGEADLKFTESSDILEAGVEIVAKPPQKHMQSIQLMSGGEKCMTALALLFAIFEVKSSPFCILDEMDAPLDDANVARFNQIVQQFVDRCQFIVITHNKVTMGVADRLFGVSMEERGVSKLLAMEFAEEEVLVETV